MWNPKYDKNEHIYKTETDSYRKQTYSYQRRKVREADRPGGCDEHIRSSVHKTDDQGGPTIG